jgi:hypothetical protein
VRVASSPCRSCSSRSALRALVADRLTAPSPGFQPPRPAAVALGDLLRQAGNQVRTCHERGSSVTCTLADGGRCTQAIGGTGSCTTAEGRIKANLESGGGTLHIASP